MKVAERHNRIDRTDRKLNNLGMSLVEVIISITILSIVVVPTLHALTTAMVYNSKARKRQEVTLSGESIMEAFKGYDIETLRRMFTNGGKDGSEVFYQQPEGATDPVYVWSEHTKDPAIADDSDYELFTIQGIQTDTGKTYNIEMKAEPSDEKNVFQITNMKSTNPVVQCEKSWGEDLDSKAFTDFSSQHASEFEDFMANLVKTDEYPDDKAMNASGNPISIADVNTGNINIYDRTLEFVIDSDGVTPVITYRYYITGVAYYKPVHPPKVTDGYTGEEIDSGEILKGTLQYLSKFPEGEDTYFSFSPVTPGKTDATDLSDVYLFYYPDYAIPSDKVVIRNNSGNDTNCYLLKQRAKDVSQTWTTTHEQNYKVKVEKNGSDDVRLYHNLFENIGTASFTVPTPQIAAAFANGNDRQGESIANVYDSAGNVKHEAADVFSEDKILSYDLTLTIRDDTGIEVSSLHSTMNEK